jgi:hypothetical protein
VLAWLLVFAPTSTVIWLVKLFVQVGEVGAATDWV